MGFFKDFEEFSDWWDKMYFFDTYPKKKTKKDNFEEAKARLTKFANDMGLKIKITLNGDEILNNLSGKGENADNFSENSEVAQFKKERTPLDKIQDERREFFTSVPKEDLTVFSKDCLDNFEDNGAVKFRNGRVGNVFTYIDKNYNFIYAIVVEDDNERKVFFCGDDHYNDFEIVGDFDEDGNCLIEVEGKEEWDICEIYSSSFSPFEDDLDARSVLWKRSEDKGVNNITSEGSEKRKMTMEELRELVGEDFEII